MFSNCCCGCSFEPEIIKIGQSSYEIHSNNILNFQESTIILNAHTKKVWKLIVCTSYFLFFSNFLTMLLNRKISLKNNEFFNNSCFYRFYKDLRVRM